MKVRFGSMKKKITAHEQKSSVTMLGQKPLRHATKTTAMSGMTNG